MTRKIIQICESAVGDHYGNVESKISALCDDGTVWYLLDFSEGWQKYPVIPQNNVLNNIESLRPIFNASETKELKWVYRIEQTSAYSGYQILKVAARNVSEQKYKFGGYYKTKEEAIRAIELITGMDFEEYEKIKYEF